MSASNWSWLLSVLCACVRARFSIQWMWALPNDICTNRLKKKKKLWRQQHETVNSRLEFIHVRTILCLCGMQHRARHTRYTIKFSHVLALARHDHAFAGNTENKSLKMWQIRLNLIARVCDCRCVYISICSCIATFIARLCESVHFYIKTHLFRSHPSLARCMYLYQYKFYCPISISIENHFYRTVHLGALLRSHWYAQRWYIFYRSIDRAHGSWEVEVEVCRIACECSQSHKIDDTRWEFGMSSRTNRSHRVQIVWFSVLSQLHWGHEVARREIQLFVNRLVWCVCVCWEIMTLHWLSSMCCDRSSSLRMIYMNVIAIVLVHCGCGSMKDETHLWTWIHIHFKIVRQCISVTLIYHRTTNSDGSISVFVHRWHFS